MNTEINLLKLLTGEDISLIQLVAKNVETLGYPVYLVGGVVRDILLNRKITDFDIVLEGDSIPLAKSLVKKYGGIQILHHRFGTAKWRIDPANPQLSLALGMKAGDEKIALLEGIDLISARSETYAKPAALPIVSAGTLQDDLKRRDFTINAMAMRIDGGHLGQVIDPWGGQEDLSNKRIRILHAKSFIDDPTRILRSVRFEQRLGFRIEDETLSLLGKSLDFLNLVSGARIRNELTHILEEENRIGMLERLQELKVLSTIHPNLVWTSQLAFPFIEAEKAIQKDAFQMPHVFGRVSPKAGISFIVWFMTLPEKTTHLICKRLSVPGNLVKAIHSAQLLWKQKEKIRTFSNSEATFFLEKFDPVAIVALSCFPDEEQLKNLLVNYLENWRFLKSYTNGASLKELGIPTGPDYKILLKNLRAARLDGKIKTKEEEQAFLGKLLNKKKN